MTIFLSIAGLFYTLVLAISFVTKKKIQSIELKIYSKLIVMTIISILAELNIAFCRLFDNDLILDVAMKLYLSCMVIWTSIFLVYVLALSYQEIFHKKFFRLFYSLINLLIILIIFLLPIHFYESGLTAYSYGPSVNFLYGVSTIYSTIISGVLILNFKNIKKRKALPVFILLILLLFAAVLQKMRPELLLINFIYAFTLFIMYHTIENPDVKIIEQLNIAKDQAEKANRAKSDFLSNMSHEIRTPLNAVVGFSEAILEENDIEQIKSDAKDIIMASNNLLEIVNGILDISKIEADKMEIVETEYDLVENLNGLAKLMIPRIGEKPIELRTKFAPDIPPILYGDGGKIKQIVMNILTNAVKYTERGLITLEVNCVNSGSECKLVISVEDTGRGIKPEKIDSIFNKFERLEEDRNTTLEGTGLGLAITKRLVEMMGGKIVVQSKYGAGSKFTVYLKQEIRAVHTNVKREITYDKLVDISNRKVLVVDDNKINLKVATRMLTPYHLNIEECESGLECIDKIKEGRRYDLILLDDMMPKMTGTEALKELEKIPDFHTPVVVLTANAIEGMKEKYLKEGFKDYLAKPIDKLELERILYTYLAYEEKKEDIFEPLPEELYDINKPLHQDTN